MNAPDKPDIHSRPTSDKNPAAVSLGALGGAARSKALTKERKIEIATAAGLARARKAGQKIKGERKPYTVAELRKAGNGPAKHPCNAQFAKGPPKAK